MNRKAIQRIARTILAALAYEIVGPLTAMALTGGPAQPEFSSFEPVTTTSMVNEFTGAFTYNLPVLSIPGPDGSGYALSLSYHSGESPEGEASWVGYGWSLNPGAISRNKRGFADDHKRAAVKYWNNVPANWTVSIGGSTQFEAFGFNPIPITASASLRYNNYKGFGYTQGLSLSYRGMASLGYDVNDGKGSFSYSVNPGKILSKLGIMGTKLEQGAAYQAGDAALGIKGLAGSRSASYTFGAEQQPTHFHGYTGINANFSLGPEICASFLPIGGEVTLRGSYSRQKNVSKEVLSTFGYMYSDSAGSDDMMDFYVEKDSPFDKRDRYTGIPFSNADNFMVTGEGVGGGFRLHNRRPGHFYPNRKESSTDIVQLGAEIHAGPMNFGFGTDIGVGNHSLTVDRWGDGGVYKFASAGENADFDEPYFFRFNNDLGGSVIQAADDKAVRAGIAMSGIMGTKSGVPDLGNIGVYERTNNGKRSGRSSYIAYHTNREMLEQSGRYFLDGTPPVNEYNSYCKDWDARLFVDRQVPEIEDGIGEFAVANENGSEYIYGLPVYSRNEKSLQYGVQGLGPSSIKRNYLAYKYVTPELAEQNDDVVIGEERSAPYASTYLLTQINSPDYIDYTYNGPTDDDFGGYTKFEYERVAGGYDKTDPNDSWYRWRIPYNGLLYNRNSLSDPMDDVGSVMSGEKEIYYLKAIETKTHIAVFITENRDDAREAHVNELIAASIPTAAGSSGTMKKLTRIELYAKDHDGNPGKLIQTVRFEYDYALCKRSPNGGASGGKLTLRKVWFEYEGAVNVRVSPYVFGYEYKPGVYFPSAIRTRYPDATSHADAYFTSNSTTPRSITVPWSSYQQNPQNPDYCAQNIDRWGNYQFDGYDRYDRMNTWVDQTPDQANFDPAAWQLKWIRLPSGGEIHVQYEQNDYRFVQDRPAMAMVTLKSSPSSSRYYLNVSELGLDDTAPNAEETEELHEMATMIKKRFIDGGERIYFRMLFPLAGLTANLQNCLSEYITGYARVTDVSVDLNGTGDDGIIIELMADNSTDYVSPADVCEELFKTSKSGNLRIGQSCDASTSGIDDNGDIEDVLMAFLGKLGTTFVPGLICQAGSINLGESYLRVPLTRAKRGGGIRVKRLLMYDAGIETADAALYGTEYLYQTEDGKSSGVATNEPATGREENALITSMVKRTELGGPDGILSGDDLDQFEGPLGESILPAPSIGYSRVVTRNIHTGSTSTGFTVSEFHTALDKPFDMTYDASAIAGKGVEHTDLKQERDWIPTLPLGPVTFGKANVWMTQGYRFVLNSMHGQPKQISTYGGDYSNHGTWSVSSRQVYEYFAPGEPVPMWDDKTFTTKNEFPGKEMEVVFANRKVEDISSNLELELDFSLGIIIPFLPAPFVTAAPSVEYSEKMLHIHTTTKVVRYPAIQKRVTSFQDGIYHVTENVAFDRLTGRPSITRTADGYDKLKLEQSATGHDGLYHTYQFPASHQYPEMSQKAVNERLIVKDGKEDVHATLYRDGNSYYISLSFETAKAACELMSRFTRGDLLRVRSSSDGSFRGTYHIHEIVGNRLKLLETSFSYGTQVLTEKVDFEVVRSGRTNQLAASAGSITTYGPQQAPTIMPPQ